MVGVTDIGLPGHHVWNLQTFGTVRSAKKKRPFQASHSSLYSTQGVGTHLLEHSNLTVAPQPEPLNPQALVRV